MIENFSENQFQIARSRNFASFTMCNLGLEFQGLQIWTNNSCAKFGQILAAQTPSRKTPLQTTFILVTSSLNFHFQDMTAHLI